MKGKKTGYKATDRNNYSVYLDKAAAFYRAMTNAFEDENWYSVGLEAVHCAISATDAVLAKKAGIRCIAKDHREAVALLEEKLGKTASEQAATLSRIIAMKNQVEYEDRIFTKKEADDIYKRTDRYFNWAKGLINS